MTDDLRRDVDDPTGRPAAEAAEGSAAEATLEADASLPAGLDQLPEDPVEALGIVLETLRQTEERANQAHQSHLRALADLDNYRKRMRREQATVASQAAARTVSSLLAVLDSFDAALVLDTGSEKDQSVLSGMRATYDLLLGTLQSQGLEIIPAAGDVFSPDLHQPINAPPPGDGEVIVSNEVRRGYRLEGRLLRPALVEVTRENEAE
ncbi:MAG: nucleotide exchange factor GrpE [bacterium]|nr:nucleotide exchange factor GrpE [bacterium]MDE0233636.1 nucleotide exchange factor GrpE [bacterium]